VAANSTTHSELDGCGKATQVEPPGGRTALTGARETAQRISLIGVVTVLI